MHYRIFYFLSNENYADEFIKSIAVNLIEEGSMKLGFYGKYQNKWNQLFDEVDIVMYDDEKMLLDFKNELLQFQNEL